MKTLKIRLLLFVTTLALSNHCFSQNVGINITGANPNPSAGLDVDFNNKGLLPPRMTTAQRDSIAISCSCTPASGLQIFNTTTNCVEVYILGLWQHMYCGCAGAPATPGTITGSASPCALQSSVTYSITAVSGATSYTWTVPSGWIITSGQSTNSIAVTVGSLGQTGNISVVASNSCGTSASNSLAVTPNSAPAGVSISANPSGAICPGSSVTFTATPANGGSAPSYQWKVNGSNVGTSSATYTSTSLTNNDKVTCVITSNASCVTGSPATSNTDTALTNSLLCNMIAYWKLDETSGNAADVRGLHPGTATAVTYSTGNGKIHNGAGFNGSSSQIEIADTSDLKPTGSFSVSFWGKTSLSAWQFFFQSYSLNAGKIAGFQIALYSGLNKLYFVSGKNTGGSIGTDYQAVYSNGGVADGVFHHWVCVYDGSNLLIYRDGVLDNSNSWSNPAGYGATNYVTIGVDKPSPTEDSNLNGAMDEVGYWSRALNSTEVSALYNSGTGLQYPF